MKILRDIKEVDSLIIGETYKEDKDGYYLATCLKVNNEVTNNGCNVYFQSADFDIKTKDGRKIGIETKSFLHPKYN